MRQVALLIFVVALAGCGGAARRDGAGPAGEAGAAPMVPPTSAPADNEVEVVDDMDHADSGYPALPEGSSSFFWRGGLGNWFVAFSDGVRRDAMIEVTDLPDGQRGKACHAAATASVGVDLWAQLNHPSGGQVDLSGYLGVAFRARLSGADAALRVAVGANGNFFEGSAPSATYPLAVSEQWQSFELSFAD